MNNTVPQARAAIAAALQNFRQTRVMKERPILFSAPMVRALLDGSKTQTRRVAKFKPREQGLNLSSSSMQLGHYMTGLPESGVVLRSGSSGCWNDRTFPLHSPYGEPGDRIWVRESYADIGCRLTYRADLDDGAHCAVKKWTPSIHMFRADSRILLEIVAVRVERLHDCSKADAIAEGVRRIGPGFERWHPDPADVEHTGTTQDPALSYRGLWESINGAGSWAANPWVWAIEFKRLAP